MQRWVQVYSNTIQSIMNDRIYDDLAMHDNLIQVG